MKRVVIFIFLSFVLDSVLKAQPGNAFALALQKNDKNKVRKNVPFAEDKIEQIEAEILDLLKSIDNMEQNTLPLNPIELSSAESSLRVKLDELKQIKRVQTIIQSLEKDTATDEVSNNAFQTLPSVLTPVGNQNFNIVPSINVVGQFQSQSGSTLHRFELFTAGTDQDSSVLKNGIKLILPEASKFGIHYNLLKSLRKSEPKTESKKSLAFLDLNMWFLAKSVPESDIQGTLTGESKDCLVGHLKVGGQGVFLDSHLSLYANLNLIGIMSGAEQYEQFFNIAEKWTSFFDLGFRVSLIFGQDSHKKESYLYLDMAFIPNININKFHTFVEHKDAVTARLNIGFMKSFSLNRFDKN